MAALQSKSLNSLSDLPKEDVNENIMKLMECPVCYELLMPPIHQCRNAHNVCDECRKQLTVCPMCNEAFLNTRSVFVEHIAENLLYPCTNADVGCPERHNLGNFKKHNEECAHRMYNCLPGKSTNCAWKGRSVDIFTHVREYHPNISYMDKGTYVYYLSHVFMGAVDLQLVFAFDEIFWYHMMCDPVKEKLFLAVQYIGPQHVARNFTYRFDFFVEGKDECSMCVQTGTHPYTEEISQIYDTGCIVLHYELLKQYLDSSNNLSFALQIEKVSESEVQEEEEAK